MELSRKNNSRPKIIYGESSSYRWEGYNPFKDELPTSRSAKNKRNYKKYGKNKK
jgi:hypothetical protein